MISLIQFKGIQIRTAGTKDEPFFCAKDVCEVLGLNHTGMALKRVPNDEKGVISNYTLGGSQKLVFVNEPGLYRLIFMSRRAEAESFKTWVFKRVLPAIRKHGEFIASRDDVPPDLPPELLALPDTRREHICLWLAIMQEIASQKMPHQKIHEIVARHPNTRSFSVPSLYRRFNAWKDSNGDWKSQRPYRAP